MARVYHRRINPLAKYKQTDVKEKFTQATTLSKLLVTQKLMIELGL